MIPYNLILLFEKISSPSSLPIPPILYNSDTQIIYRFTLRTMMEFVLDVDHKLLYPTWKLEKFGVFEDGNIIENSYYFLIVLIKK
jgi:hypothetical protein